MSKNRRFTEREDERMTRLRIQGLSLDAIGKRLHRGKSSIQQRLYNLAGKDERRNGKR